MGVDARFSAWWWVRVVWGLLSFARDGVFACESEGEGTMGRKLKRWKTSGMCEGGCYFWGGRNST